MRLNRIIAFILLCIILVPNAEAQNRKRKSHSNEFDLQFRAGLNFCQIDGDNSGNYNKLGFHGGVNTSFPIGDGGWRFLVELGLTQKGSNINNDGFVRNISLLYVEVPLLLTYNLVDNRLRLGAGIAPAILAKAHVTTDKIYDPDHSNNYKRMDLLPVCLSLGYRINDMIGFDIRWYNSILNTAIENGSGTYRIWRNNKGQFNRLIEAGLTFNF